MSGQSGSEFRVAMVVLMMANKLLMSKCALSHPGA